TRARRAEAAGAAGTVADAGGIGRRLRAGHGGGAAPGVATAGAVAAAAELPWLGAEPGRVSRRLGMAGRARTGQRRVPVPRGLGGGLERAQPAGPGGAGAGRSRGGAGTAAA